MPNKIFALAASAVLLAMPSACATLADPPPANATDRSRSSWCQGDNAISYAQADRAGQNDPGNQLDSDETVAEIQAHNARRAAACVQP